GPVRPWALARPAARVAERVGRAPRAGGRPGRPRARHAQGPDPPRAHGRRVGGLALRLARRQARQVERHRADVGGSGPGRGRGTDEPRGRCPPRRHASPRARAPIGGGRLRLRCLLSLPGRAGGGGGSRGGGGHPSRRLDPRRRGRGGGRPIRDGDGPDRGPTLPALTTSGWVFTERDVVRLLALTPRRADQLRRLGLLHAGDPPRPYHFRDLVGLRVARSLLEAGVTVRQIRKALEALRRLVPDADAPLAELRVTVRDG